MKTMKMQKDFENLTNSTEYRDITARELAVLLRENVGQKIVGFTFDTVEALDGEEAEGWYGAKIDDDFDSGFGALIIGDYGGDHLTAVSLYDYIFDEDYEIDQSDDAEVVIDAIEELILKYFREEGEFDFGNRTVCTDFFQEELWGDKVRAS